MSQISEKIPLISLKHICVRGQKADILKDVSLKVYAGEIVTVVGPNGAGKTTLLKVVLGVLKPESGSIRRKKNLTVGYMPQKLSLPKMIPITAKRFLRLDANYPFEQLKEVLQVTGIENLLQHDVRFFSGGELQRLLLARALLRKPDLLVLDEPVQGLDVNGEEDFYELLKILNEKYHCAVLMVSHDLRVVMAATNKVICLNRHICCEGKPSEIEKNSDFETMFQKRRQLAFYEHHHDHAHTQEERTGQDD